jgi:hypothetical protein
MLVKVSTDKTVTETASALQAAVEANHFGVMQVHNLKETMTKKGVRIPTQFGQRSDFSRTVIRFNSDAVPIQFGQRSGE